MVRGKDWSRMSDGNRTTKVFCYRCGVYPSPPFESFGKGRVARDKLAASEGGLRDDSFGRESWGEEDKEVSWGE